MALYKLQAVDPEINQEFVIKDPDGNPRTIIPFDPENTDYQEYLAWKDAGNTADPAD
tara:strand:+ start:2274 stop:2444 length:171 start_codon:yes stop_codon:yes gene_type:complete